MSDENENNPPTITDLEDARATALDRADEIIRTIQEDPERETFTDDERGEYDGLLQEADRLEGEITRTRVAASDAERFEAAETRRRRFDVPNLGTGATPARAGRSLDELLWATDEVVRAGSVDVHGNFRPDPLGAGNPVEQVIVRTESAELGAAPRIGEFSLDHQSLIRSFQRTVADMTVFGLMVDRKAKSSDEGFEVARTHEAYEGRWQDLCRAMDIDTAAEGQNWVPTGIGASLHEKVRAAGRVAPLFSRIDLPTNPWKLPVEGADSTAYRVAEPTGDSETKMTASTPGTLATTFDAELLGARTLYSRSITADSAIAVAPFAQGKLVRAFVDGEEKAILDGDTDGTHQDSDVGASTTDARTAWDGLRKKAIANTSVVDGGNNALTAADVLAVRQNMGKWGLNPADLALIVGVSGYHDLLGDSNLQTVDKFGPQATILAGQVGALYGVPVIVSEHVREDLNATGVHDGITTNRSYALIVNRGEWLLGQRMALDVESDDSIYRETFQRVLVGFMREDFQHIGDAAGNDDTAIVYNVT